MSDRLCVMAGSVGFVPKDVDRWGGHGLRDRGQGQEDGTRLWVPSSGPKPVLLAPEIGCVRSVHIKAVSDLEGVGMGGAKGTRAGVMGESDPQAVEGNRSKLDGVVEIMTE